MVNYKLLYTDFVYNTPHLSYKDKREILNYINEKLKIEASYKQLIRLNTLITQRINYRTIQSRYSQLKAYDKDYILSVLKHQKEYQLSNREVSNMFQISRNTLSKWKKAFEMEA